MKAAFFSLLAAVALVAAPAVLQAGGGTKATGTIRVQNDSGETILVVVARSNNPLTNLNNLLSGGGTATQAQVRAAAAADGARVVVVNDGNVGTIAGLQAGAYTVTAAEVTAGTVGGGFLETAGPVNLGRGQRATLTVEAGGTIS
jgi:hypothetical protein